MKGILYLNIEIFENEMLYKKALSLVSRDRKDKFKQMKDSLPARLSLGAGLLLSIALDECGLSNKIDEIEYEEYGKPYLRDSNFHFNLTHSGNYVVCAYSDARVGADLQKIKTQIPKYTKKILSLEEINYLNTLVEADKINVFYRLWSRKESLIKWDGRGLRIPLHEISFIKNEKITDEIIFEDKALYFKEYNIWMPEYAFCLCKDSNDFSEKIDEINRKFLTKY